MRVLCCVPGSQETQARKEGLTSQGAPPHFTRVAPTLPNHCAWRRSHSATLQSHTHAVTVTHTQPSEIFGTTLQHPLYKVACHRVTIILSQSTPACGTHLAIILDGIMLISGLCLPQETFEYLTVDIRLKSNLITNNVERQTGNNVREQTT